MNTNKNHDSAKPQPGWIRPVLIAAGIYNLAWGVWIVLFPNALFTMIGIQPPLYPQIWQCVGMIVGVYGIGYLISAGAPLRHWPIVLVGFLGKTFGPIGFVASAVRGELPWAWGWTIITNDPNRCVIPKQECNSMRYVVCLLTLSTSLFVQAAGPEWENPLRYLGKLNSPLVETTPFVFKDRFYLLENWQKQWEFAGSQNGSRTTEDEIRIRDVADERIVSIPLLGHGLGMALVHESRLYIFAGDWGTGPKWNITRINLDPCAGCSIWS